MIQGTYNANPETLTEGQSGAPLFDNKRRLQVIIAGNASASNAGTSYSQMLVERQTAGSSNSAVNKYGIQLVDAGTFSGTPTDYAIAPSTTAFLAVAPDASIVKFQIQNQSASVTMWIREDGVAPTAADSKSKAILPNTVYESTTPTASGVLIYAPSAIAGHVTVWIK